MKTCEEITREVLRRRDEVLLQKSIKRKAFFKKLPGVSCLVLASFIFILIQEKGLLNTSPENYTNTSLPENSVINSESEHISNSEIKHESVTEEKENNKTGSDIESSEEITSGYDPSKENKDTAQSTTPSAVRKTVNCDYDKASKLWGDNLKKCDDPDFLMFSVGLVTLNGVESNGEAVCSDITYKFKNGEIFIYNGDIFDLPSEPIYVQDIYGEPYYKNTVSVSYKERVFYTEFTDNGTVKILYFSKNKTYAYNAEFSLSENAKGTDNERKAETERIYELILSIEI